MKEIQVLDKNGNILSFTYPKRAKQLVKSERAVWSGPYSISLIENKTEGLPLDYDYAQNGPRNYEVMAETAPVDIDAEKDAMLYKLAEKRLKERRGLIMHFVSYVAVNFALAVTALMMYETWFVYVLVFWGVGLVCHAADYFTKASPYAVEREYLRQKKIVEKAAFSGKIKKRL